MSTETTAPTCLACGNNPTSHFNAKIDTTFFLLVNPVMQWILRGPLGYPLVHIVQALFHILLFVGTKVGFMRFVPVEGSTNSMRGDVMAAEAKARGYGFEILLVGKRRHDTYRLTIPGKKPITFSGVPRIDSREAVTSGWIDDKWLLKKCLMAAGVTVSSGRVVYTLGAAKAAFAELKKPVIVKPRFGSRGRHTTTNITTEALLVKAFKSAQQLSLAVIVEEHLVGSVYRATCIGGRCVGILAGDPPRITGDGARTIAALIEAKNASRPARVGEVKITDKLLAFITNLGYELTSVLPAHKTIDLSEKIGLSYGGSSREVTPSTHPALMAEMEKAAAAVNDPIIGFDFISPDVTADPATVRWGIIECNSVPFINLHHDPLEGTPINAAAVLFDYLHEHLPSAPVGHTRALVLFTAVAIFFALVPILWYVPHLKKEQPPLIARVTAIAGDEVTVRFQKDKTMTLFITASTSPQMDERLIGQRLVITLDPVLDDRREIVTYRIIEK